MLLYESRPCFGPHIAEANYLGNKCMRQPISLTMLSSGIELFVFHGFHCCSYVFFTFLHLHVHVAVDLEPDKRIKDLKYIKQHRL